MVDVSGSMASGMSGRSQAQRWELASLFGAALAVRAAHADVVAFESDAHAIEVKKGESILRSVDKFKPYVGGGTETWPAVRKHFDKHDRIVIVTDEQAFWDGTHEAKQASEYDVPIYTFNVAGYQHGNLPSGGQRLYTFGGLTDQGFAAIEMLERGRDLDWDRLFKLKGSGADASEED